MKWSFVVALAVAADPGSAQAQLLGEGPDRGAEVRRVLATKCAVCHGSDLPKPKGRFGYVLDLKRIAGNPELVIPGQPDESELWLLVRHGDMPPPDSASGPLTTAEKESIRAWIAAGAPDVRASPSEAPTVHRDQEQPDPAPEVSPSADRLVRFLGKFHLLLLHFPIALLIAAGIGEFLIPRRGARGPAPAVLFCLILAAVAVVPTVALGWLHAQSGTGLGSARLLTAHRWLGTVTGAWVVATAVWAGWVAHRGARSRGVRLALAVGIVLVIAAAHAGGLLAHGRTFFDW